MTADNASSMLAARARAGERHFSVETVPLPRPGPGEVLVRVESAGMTRGLIAMWWFTQMIPLPATLGHDIAGTVTEVGAGVEAVAPGQRVWISTALTCGACASCLRGADNMCEALGVMGYAVYGRGGNERHHRYADGGFAEFVLAPAVNVNPLPDAVDFSVAGKLGTIAGGLRALLTAEVEPGDTVLVTGAGGATGGSVVRLAPLLGAARIIVTARSAEGLQRVAAKTAVKVEAVATDALSDGWEGNAGLTTRLRELTDGRGVDAVVDLMPSGTEVTQQALQALAPGGRCVLMGGNVQRLTISYLDVMRNQWRINGNRGHRRSDETAVATLLAGGSLDLSDLVTHSFPLAEVNGAIDLVMGREARPGMVVVTPQTRS